MYSSAVSASTASRAGLAQRGSASGPRRTRGIVLPRACAVRRIRSGSVVMELIDGFLLVAGGCSGSAGGGLRRGRRPGHGRRRLVAEHPAPVEGEPDRGGREVGD